MDRNRGLIACLPALSLLYLLVFPLPVDLPSGIAMVSFASADTVPGGNVSGTWYEASSPYYIAGNITIQAGDTLTIEPGVEVNFLNGMYSLNVNGFLEAIGTEADSISFTGGFCIIMTADSSSLIYCSISSFSNRMCVAGSSSPEISHSRFDNNAQAIDWESTSDATISDCVISNSTDYGGILWWSLADLTLVDCVICDNTSSYPGAGVRAIAGDRAVAGGTVEFINCTITANSTEKYGGGVSFTDGTAIFTNCTISNNYAGNQGGGVSVNYGTATFTECTIKGNDGFSSATPTNGGGGISLYNSSGTLSYCTVFDNFTFDYGGGIAVTNGDLVLDHCSIVGNEAWDYGSGISIVSGGTADITNSIISYNFDDYSIYNEGTVTLGYSDFYGNTSGDISGNVPSGFGDLDRVNYNGDSCDVFYNIFLDPVFVDLASGDLHLLAGSPCIDAGDPTFPYDPDGTITDMGRYYFNQTGTGGSTPVPLPPGHCLLSCHPNPCRQILNVHFEVPGQPAPSLYIYGLDGRLIADMTDCLLSDTGDLALDVSGMCEGVYLCRLAAGDASRTMAFVVIR